MLKQFDKVAAKGAFLKDVGKKLTDYGSKAMTALKGGAKGAKAGLAESAKHTVGDTLKLKGIGQGYEHAAKNLGKAKGLKDKSRVVGEALGKAAPSLAVGGAYAYGAKKLYDKTVGSNSHDGQYY